MATPGSIVNIGKLVTPGGAQGPPGQVVNISPLADATQDGLLRKVSGNIADYVGGDNNCHPLSIANYYGADTGTATALAATVAASFALQTGVTVFVTPANNCGTSPTLNVNGTGAKPIVTRANIALSANEIVSGKVFGVVYDGTSWRVVTPLSRIYYGTNPANPAINCAGYDSVFVSVTFTSATGAGITLQFVGPGVQVCIDVVNSTGAAMAWFVNVTDSGGTLRPTYWLWANALSGSSVIRMDSTTQPAAMTNATRFMAFGCHVENAYFFFK